MAQEMIGEDDRHHGFTYWDGANADAWIVAALRDDFRLVAVRVDCAARSENG